VPAMPMAKAIGTRAAIRTARRIRMTIKVSI
jgi:hypothetical protein